MNSIVRALITITIFLTAALFVRTTSQTTAGRSDAGNHLCSVMRCRQRMLQKQDYVSVSEHTTYYTVTQNNGGLPASKGIVYKPEVTRESYLAAPSYTRPRYDRIRPGVSPQDRPRQSRQSTSRDHRGVGEQVAAFASQPRNSYSSLSTYPERMTNSRYPSRRYVNSTKAVDRRLSEDVELFDSERRGSFSSSASYSERLLMTHSWNLSYRFRKSTRYLNLEPRKSDSTSSNYLGRMLKTSLHSASTSTSYGWWRKITNFETNDEAEITDQSVAKLTRNKKSKVDLKTDLDNPLVNETVLFVQLNRDTNIGDASTVGYRSGPCSLNNDKNDIKAHGYGCQAHGSVRRRRDGGSSGKTAQDYTSESTTDAGDSANYETTPTQEDEEERQTAMQNVSKSVTEETNLGSNTTSETTEGYTSLPKTTLQADPRGNVSMPAENLGLVTTPGGSHVDYRSTVKDTPSQQTSGDGGEDEVLCSDTSDFGQYGIRTFAVSSGIVVLLVYVLGMVLVMRRFLKRRKFRAAAHCPVQESKAAGWLDVVPGSFPFDAEIEEPVTDSRLNLMALNTSLTYDSDPSGDTTREDNSYNVSTFLLRRESQQKSEERARQGKEEVQHDQVEITTEL